MRSAFLLLLLTVAAHLGPWLRPDWAGTEGQRVLVAHGMLASGNWLVPHMGGEPLLTKPPLFYWALAGVEAVCGVSPFAARTPSVLGIWWTALVAFGVVSRLVGRRAGWWSAICTVLAPALVWHGAFAEIDPLFASLTTVSLLWLVDGAVRRDRRSLALGGFVGALAILTKGPPYAMFLAGPLVIAIRRQPRLVLAWFIPWLVLPLALFAMAFFRALDAYGAASAVASTAASESIGRILTFDLKSLADVPLHFVRAILYAMPFAFWLLPRLRSADTAGRPTEKCLTAACVTAYVGAVVALVFFPARPARYLLPGIPLLAPAVAGAMARYVGSDTMPHYQRAGFVVSGVATAVLIVLVFLPGEPSVSAILGWSLLGLGALGARGRSGSLALLLATPVVLIGTIITDGIAHRSTGLRDEMSIAAMLRESLSRHGATSFEFVGNPGESLALLLDPDARWRDRVQRDVMSDFVIARVRDGENSPLDLGRWIERERVRGRDRVFVVAQRRG